MSRHITWCAVAVAGLGFSQLGLTQPPAGHGVGYSYRAMDASGARGLAADPVDAAGHGPPAWTDHSAGAASRADPQLGQNSALNAKLQALLPGDMSPQQACAGFDHLGSCVAALHVARNLGIPFSDLKSRLTGPDAVSLGSAIQGLQPQANAGRAQRIAQQQAESDLSNSGH